MPELSILHSTPFYELAALISLAALAGFIGLILRQPMIVSFIAVGVLAGPSVLDIVRSEENIDLMAELGIAVLLFLVGLKLDLKLIRTLGAVALATGIGQVVFTSVVGFLLCLALGLPVINALYVAIALTFSSTIIIVKLLTDKRESDSLHGRIAIGFLIVQDLVVVLAMIALSAFGVGAEQSADRSVSVTLLGVLLPATAIAVFMVAFIRYAANPMMHYFATSTELLVVFAIGWSALLAAVAHFLGFSKELGGLLAGVTLASTPYREAIVSRLAPLRDFLLLFFFIALGMQLELTMLGEQIGAALVLSLFVLIGNPLIVMIIMGLMGYRKRTGFLAGLTVAQISEFSLIFIAMGITLGHIGADMLGLVTLVGLITIALSVYMITYSHSLYQWLEPALGWFERKEPFRETAIESEIVSTRPYDVILFGLGRYGRALAGRLAEADFRVLALDFDPAVIRQWQRPGVDASYGDAGDHELIAHLPLADVKWVVCALPGHNMALTHTDPRITLIEELRRHNFRGRVAMAVHKQAEVEEMAHKGADLVLFPFEDAAERAGARIVEASRGDG